MPLINDSPKAFLFTDGNHFSIIGCFFVVQQHMGNLMPKSEYFVHNFILFLGDNNGFSDTSLTN